MRILFVLLITILFLNTVMAIDPILPPSPNEQLFDRMTNLDNKINTILKANLDLGTNMSEDMNKLATGSDLNQMKIELSEKIDRKLEVPILVIALILNNILIGAFVFYLKSKGRI